MKLSPFKFLLYNILKIFLFLLLTISQIIIVFDKEEILNNSDFIIYLSLYTAIILAALIFETKLNSLLEQRHFAIFPINYKRFLFIKIWDLLFKKKYIYLILLFSTFLFSKKISFSLGLTYFIITTFQILFTIFSFFIIWDFLFLRKLNKHIALLPFLNLFLAIFSGSSNNYFINLFNPFSAAMALPTLVKGAYHPIIYIFSFSVIPILFFLLFISAKKIIKEWI